ncbi:hypothetical protein GCM10008018_00280 [Paenibacillus marchantiophytorum]|uniref:Spore coat protein n=1 Tax=Paenibacillus marchantiophytorum TaxID=1619310 RepID=A0ABQ2BMB4_9BACL|nr:hypothetical protein [Paenibacillus marchantiophytorum]GGI43084.1 hypothetical protein GCM10008018_00280 [Paenibacillus marchantiophytorum]
MYNNNNNFNGYGASSYGNASQGIQGSQGTQGYQASTSQYQGNNNTQYQGYQKQFQPSGFVQSFYSQQNPIQQSTQSYSQAPSPDAFHTANYRGNQPGHDAYLHSDSSTPSQQQTNYQGGYASISGINSTFNSQPTQQFGYATQQSYAPTQYGSSVQSNQSYGQANVSPNAYHTANYRGNQPGHDAYLRSDSSTPSQQSFQSGYGAQQAAPQQSYQQQQGIQSFSPTFNNSGIGQQYGYNSSY